MSQAISPTGFKRSRTMSRSLIKCLSIIILKLRADCGGMTRHLALIGPWGSAQSPKEIAPILSWTSPRKNSTKKNMDPISKALEQHYSAKFSLHGPSPEGVDWCSDETRMFLRYVKMLNIANFAPGNPTSLLDVGCGYGGLLQFAIGKHVDLDYTGIDVADNMIEWAVANLPSGRFLHGDILD